MENSTLVKFGKKEHIENLYNNGELYMSNLPCFWELEGDECRYDPNDSLSEYHAGNRGYMTLKTIEGKEVKISITNWGCRIPPVNPETINLFCMYALRPFHGFFPVDERNFIFGDTALVMLNGDEFIKRVGNALDKESIVWKANLVEYVDDDYTGKIGPFRKHERFRYQSEWRIVCMRGSEDPRKLYVGNLRDISQMILAKEINSEIKIAP